MDQSLPVTKKSDSPQKKSLEDQVISSAPNLSASSSIEQNQYNSPQSNNEQSQVAGSAKLPVRTNNNPVPEGVIPQVVAGSQLIQDPISRGSNQAILFKLPSFGCIQNNSPILSSNVAGAQRLNSSSAKLVGAYVQVDTLTQHQRSNIFFNRNVAENSRHSNPRGDNVLQDADGQIYKPEEEQKQAQRSNLEFGSGGSSSYQVILGSNLDQLNGNVLLGRAIPQSQEEQKESLKQHSSETQNQQLNPGQLRIGNSGQYVQMNPLESNNFGQGIRVNQTQDNQINHIQGRQPSQQAMGVPVINGGPQTILTHLGSNGVTLQNLNGGNSSQNLHYNVPLVGYPQQPIIQNSQFLYGGNRSIIESFMHMQQSDIFSQPQQYLVVSSINNQQSPFELQQRSSIALQNVQNSVISSLQVVPNLSSSVGSNQAITGNLQVYSEISNSQGSYRQVQNSVSNIQQSSVNLAPAHNQEQLSREQIQTNNLQLRIQRLEAQEESKQQAFLRPNSLINDSDLLNLDSQREERLANQFRIEELKADEVEQVSDESNNSSIPSEHEEGLNFNEYIRRYALNIVTITWNRDSHGLFDFEVRQLARENFLVSNERNFIRIKECCKLVDPKVNIRQDFAKKAQLLMQIKQYRNRYLLVTPIKYMLKNAIGDEEVKHIQERDVENFYSEIGEQLLQPYDMGERMYLVVKSIINEQNVHQDYELKKGDIIKVGRAKFLVREINIAKKNQVFKEKNERILRHRKGYALFIAKQRSVSAQIEAQQQQRQQQIQFVNLASNRQPAHAMEINPAERVRNRSALEIQIDTMNQVMDSPAPRNRSPNDSNRLTQLTENDNKAGQAALEESIDYPEYLNLLKSENSSNDSDLLKSYRGQTGQDNNFKKVIKKYRDLEMAPLEQPVIDQAPVADRNLINSNQRREVINAISPLNSAEQASGRDCLVRDSNSNEQISPDHIEYELPILRSKESQHVSNSQVPQTVVNQPAKEDVGLDSSSAYCRFCWANEHDNQNPLISSCNCSGGVRFVHFECLKVWIRTKMVSQETPRIKMFFWKTFECEICKSVFPSRFKTQNGLKYSLFDFQLDSENNYIVLEGINIDKSPSKLIYVMTPLPNNKSFKMGRANDQDIRINDISVSRQHATLNFEADRFTIKDNLSKFGTLIQIQNHLELKPNQTRIIQVGRTIMNVSLRPIKRQEPKTSAILWHDDRRSSVIAPNNAENIVHDIKNLQDNKKNVKDMCSRIKNTEAYIKQQSNVHRRMLESANFESVGYNIERRLLNANLDDFYKNQARDESSESDNEVPPIINRRQQAYEEESKSPLVNQRDAALRLSNQANRPIPPTQQRAVPNGRIFIDYDPNHNQNKEQQKPGQPGAQKPGQPGAQKPGQPGISKPGQPNNQKPPGRV